MPDRSTRNTLLSLLLAALALGACDGGSEGTTITSTADGIVGEVDADDADDADNADDAANVATDESADDSSGDGSADTQSATDEDAPPEPGGIAGVGDPAGLVVVDGVDFEMFRVDRCVPGDRTTERIESIDGIGSLETLNLIANGNRGKLEVSYTDAGSRSVTLDWHGEGGGLDATYIKVTDDADWIDGGGTTAGQPLDVVDGTAVGVATIDGRELRFELPIPNEATC